MPKIKTHKSTAKRFRRTKGGKGKLVRTKQGKSHLRRKKSKRAKRQFSKMILVENKGSRRRIRRLMPDLGRVRRNPAGVAKRDTREPADERKSNSEV